jgi:hypothetical protein
VLADLGGNKMNKFRGRDKNIRRGAVLIIAMIFVVIFSSLGLAMFKMSSTNVQLADNHRQGNRALESAQSGLEVVRYWMGRVCMPGTTAPADRFTTLANYIDTDMATVEIDAAQIYDDDGDTIAVGVPDITLDSSIGQSFSASIEKTVDLDVMQVDITGTTGSLAKTIRVNYSFGTRAHNVFDFGVATRGPLNLLGNIEMNGTNVAVEADVYIESPGDDNALSIIGNSQIAGDVTITNPDAVVTLQGGQASIGGEMGQDAIDNHVSIGDVPVEFPVPLPGYFEQYVQNTFDPAVDDTSTDATYENIRIPGGTNPTFSGNTTFRGVVFIESPNVVTFTGNVDVTGLIIGDGELNDNSGTNQIIFLGSVASAPVSDLSTEFGELRNETGTFLMAPGFSASFGGSFETLNGAIAANGIEFFGNAGGTIAGSVINYSDTPMTLSGNADLFFNRSGITEVPAGFGPEIIVHYIPSSYSEVVNL